MFRALSLSGVMRKNRTMNKRRFSSIHTTLASILLALSLLAGSLVGGTRPVEAQELLTNGGFEQPHGDGISLTAPPGWGVWANQTSGLVGRQLRVGQEVVSSAGIYQGSGSFDAYKGWATYSISLYQTVSGIQPGSTVRLTAFGRIWSCDSDPDSPTDPCITGDGNVVPQTDSGAVFRVGIDPAGNNDPNAAGIVWSGTTAPYQAFQQMTVDAAATGDRVTVVLNASMQVPKRHQHVFWDAASLTLVTGSASTGTGAATGAVAPAVAAEVVPQGEREDGSIVHTVRSGDTLAAIAVAYNVPIPDLLALNGLTMEQARFIQPGQKLIIKPATGAAAPAAETGEGEAGTEPEGESAEPVVVEGAQRPIEEYESAPVAAADIPVMQVAEAVTSGQVCVLLFEDANANRLREGGETLLAEGQIILTQGGATLSTYATDGASEPYCFANLTPGAYFLVMTPPGGYGATTPDTYAVQIQPGRTVQVAFGVAPGFVPPQAPPVSAGGLFSDEVGLEEDTQTSVLDMLYEYSGVIVLGVAGVVLVVGGGLLALLRRR